MTIRNVTENDISEVIILMQEFAFFDGSQNEIVIDAQKLLEAYSGKIPGLYGLVIEGPDGLVGFLNYFYTYSSFELSKCIWVEDVFIRESYRGKGLGRAVFKKVKSIAQEEGCSRVDWLVRKDNLSGISFYDSIGAKVDEDTIHVKWPLRK